jgi:glycerol-3-phosphate dehydrogenase
VTRDYVFDVKTEHGNTPLLSIYGGKITTYRRLAEHALEKLERFLPGLGPAWTDSGTLPGGDLPNGFDGLMTGLRSSHGFLPPELAARYGRQYGSLCLRFLEGAKSMADLGEDFGAGLHAAEAGYLVEREWARSADDILWRRTKLGLLMPPEGRARLKDWIAQQSGAKAEALVG